MKAIILCGGGGTRLWPMSREKTPKQFHRLINNYSLLQDTVRRISPLVKPQDIYISTNAQFVDEVKFQLLDVPRENIIAEPSKMDNAPAIGLALINVMQHIEDDNEPVAILSADHHFLQPERFLQVLQRAESFARESDRHVVTIGVRPTYPATTYGYIKMQSDELAGGVFQVERFVEKPDAVRAQNYAESWEYLWNLGIFIARPQVLLNLYKQHLPNTYANLEKLQQTLGTPEYELLLPAAFASMDKISIDFGILEKTSNIAVAPADGLGWTDVGNWRELKNARMDADENRNVFQGQVVAVDTTDSLVFSQGKKVVGVFGLENMIVVDTDDALLVMPADRAPDIKQLVDKLKAGHLHDYL